MVAMANKMCKVVLCICVSIVWLGGAAAEIGRRKNNITRSMLQEVVEVMGREPVRYTEPTFNETVYTAAIQFDMRAMGLLYNSTQPVIDIIANKQAYPEGIVTVSDGHPNVKPLKEEWRPLLVHYAGPTAVIAVTVLVIAVLPLAGLLWCCCYWCRIGRRRRPFDRKYDEWLKGILSIILIGLLTLFLFGVVCAFATDSQVESGAVEAPDTIRAGLNDTRVFLNETQRLINWVLVFNYNELETSLNKQLRSLGMTASWKLGAFSRAASVTTLNQMVQDLDAVQRKLRTVQSLTAELRGKAEELNTGLRKVKNQLLQTLAKCDQPKCRALQEKYKIGQLDTEIQYSQMPDVSELLNNVTQLLDSDIKSEVAQGQKAFSDIQRGIQRSIDQRMPDVSSSLRKLGVVLERAGADVSAALRRADAALAGQEAPLGRAARLHARWGPARRLAALGAATALLLVTLLLAWGVLCGVCGKRPDAYGAGQADCCNKGTGAKSLLCGMGVIFLLGSAVLAVMLAHFGAGVLATRFVCDPLTEPRGNRLFADVEKMVDFEYTLFGERKEPNFTLTSAIVQCHANRTIYQTLHLWRAFNLSDVRATLRAELAARSAPPGPLLPRPPHAPVVILHAAARRKLQQLASTGLSDFDFDRILSALETNMTSLALDQLVQQLNSTARSLQQPLFAAEAASLLQASAALCELQDAVLRPMLEHSARLNSTALELRDDLRFNHSSLKEAITYLVHETSEGEAFLNEMRTWSWEDITDNLTDVVGQQMDTYLQHVERTLRQELGRCGPLSNAFNSTRDAFCRKILMPVNGYWMSLAWCALLTPLLLLVSRRLARLYARPAPYPGARQDSEYLYDAYADRDNVPLANAYKAEKRAASAGRGARDAREARGRGARGDAGGAGGGACRADCSVAPPLDAYHARRYNDMAPKHWEEGPPRYLGSTEYERPPPYYYPGPHDRQ